MIDADVRQLLKQTGTASIRDHDTAQPEPLTCLSLIRVELILGGHINSHPTSGRAASRDDPPTCLICNAAHREPRTIQSHPRRECTHFRPKSKSVGNMEGTSPTTYTTTRRFASTCKCWSSRMPSDYLIADGRSKRRSHRSGHPVGTDSAGRQQRSRIETAARYALRTLSSRSRSVSDRQEPTGSQGVAGGISLQLKAPRGRDLTR